MALLKRKGDLAELKVAADLLDRGCRLSIPFGEDCDYDLIADAGPALHRIQVKYTESNGKIILIRCRSHSLTKGKIRHTKHYTAATVDWIAVYDRTTDRCYYCPSSELGSGRCELSLRLVAARNGQKDRRPKCRGLHRARSKPGSSSGASRIRTGGLVLAKHALCQLSYGPACQL